MVSLTRWADTATGIALVHAHQPIESLLHLVDLMLHLHLVVFEDVANLLAAPLIITSGDNVAVLYYLTNLAPITL